MYLNAAPVVDHVNFPLELGALRRGLRFNFSVLKPPSFCLLVCYLSFCMPVILISVSAHFRMRYLRKNGPKVQGR